MNYGRSRLHAQGTQLRFLSEATATRRPSTKSTELCRHTNKPTLRPPVHRGGRPPHAQAQAWLGSLSETRRNITSANGKPGGRCNPHVVNKPCDKIQSQEELHVKPGQGHQRGCMTVAHDLHQQQAGVRLEVSRQISDFRLGIPYFGFQISDSGFGSSDFRFQTSDSRFQIPDFRLGISYFRLGATDFRLQIAAWDCRFQISGLGLRPLGFRAPDFRLRISDLGFQTWDFILQISDLGFQISDSGRGAGDCRLGVPGFRLQIWDSRFRISDFRLGVADLGFQIADDPPPESQSSSISQHHPTASLGSQQ